MKIITVSSFKGGTAKTSASINLGSALSCFHNKKVLLIDFDSQANLTSGFGFDPDNQDSLATVLQKQKKIEDILLKTCLPNLDIIPADTWLERIEVTGNLASDRYSHERLGEAIKTISHNYDFAIIDTPPSLCWLTESALIAADYTLICATPEFYSVKGLQRLSYFIHYIAKRHPIDVLGVVLSFWNKRGKSNKAFLEIIETTFPNKIFNTKIRRDISVTEASVKGKPIFLSSKNSRAAQDYISLTREVLQKTAASENVNLVYK